MSAEQPYLVCGCGKRGWTVRRPARAVVKRLRREARTGQSPDPRAELLRAYRCSTGLWHVGHTSPAYVGPNQNDGRVRWVS